MTIKDEVPKRCLEGKCFHLRCKICHKCSMECDCSPELRKEQLGDERDGGY